MKTFFTADNHFGSESATFYNGRGEDASDAAEIMIARWNDKVEEDDEVFVLGDFAAQTSYFELLHFHLAGKKTYVLGNHDPKEWRGEDGARKMRAMLTGADVMVNEGHIIERQGVKLFLSHRPFASWPWDCIHLHGHLHAGKSVHENEIYEHHPYRIDVGVDCWKLEPVGLEEILGAVKIRPFTAEDLEKWTW